MGLFHKKLTDALAAIKSKEFNKAIEILEEHEREDVVFSGYFKDLAQDIETYDQNLRIAIASLKTDRSKTHSSAKTHIRDSLQSLEAIKDKLRSLTATEILLE